MLENQLSSISVIHIPFLFETQQESSPQMNKLYLFTKMPLVKNKTHFMWTEMAFQTINC